MKSHNGFSLIELLAVIAIVTVLFSVFGKLFTDGWVTSHHAIKQAENNQLIRIVMKRWQKALHRTTSATWKIEDGTFIAGKQRIFKNGNCLTFDDGIAAKNIFLAENIGHEFSIERHDNMADCAILTLSMESHYFQLVRTNVIRIVACAEKDFSVKEQIKSQNSGKTF